MAGKLARALMGKKDEDEVDLDEVGPENARATVEKLAVGRKVRLFGAPAEVVEMGDREDLEDHPKDLQEAFRRARAGKPRPKTVKFTS